MTRPPAFALWLLEQGLPARDRDAIVGDLCEEYSAHAAPALGSRRARAWFWRQVMTSVVFQIVRAWERASTPRASAALATSAALALAPGAALLWLRAYVLFHVPLRADATPSTAFAAVLIVLLVASTAAALRLGIAMLDASRVLKK
ncbi:MAG: hypothetical protein AB1635_21280 [Acidobacteriota bacterium]